MIRRFPARGESTKAHIRRGQNIRKRVRSNEYEERYLSRIVGTRPSVPAALKITQYSLDGPLTTFGNRTENNHLSPVIKSYLLTGNFEMTEMATRQILREIANWTVPPNLQELIRKSIRRVDRPKHMMTVKKNKVFHNRHLGQRCFILATGPSIKLQDLSHLENEISIAINFFYLHSEFKQLNPRYYLCTGRSLHDEIAMDAWMNCLKEMAAAVSGSESFFPIGDQPYIEGSGFFPRQKVYYLNFHSSSEVLLREGVDLTRPVLSPQNSVIMALQIAIYMGFSKIYLLGCDHDWPLHLKETYYPHFYDSKAHPLIRQGYGKIDTYSVDCTLKGIVQLWKHYRAIKAVADSRSIEIVNATRGGLLDVFPRIEYESLFEK
jgi:hypothetical protein